MQRGFIQIPILIAIIIAAVLGSSAYVAYENARPSQNAFQNEKSASETTTSETILGTSADEGKKSDISEAQGSSLGEGSSAVVGPNIPFDRGAMAAVLQIQVRDNSGRLVSWGTGMGMGGNGILTNYHVVESVIKNPSGYKVYGCLTQSLNVDANCKHLLSITPNLFGRLVGSPTYNAQWDLAFLYLDKINVTGQWKSWTDVPLKEFGFSTVDLSTYIKTYLDAHIGDSVYAIGYPDYGNGKSVQVDGQIVRFAADYRSGQPLVVSDFKISRGNSGGPVFNSAGKLVGVTVQCYTDANDKCYAGLYIPLPTVHWWLTNDLALKIWTWEGRSGYISADQNTEVLGGAMCLLRQNARYDPSVSTESCTCNAGFSKSVPGGDCDVQMIDKNALQKSLEGQQYNDTLCQAQYGIRSAFNSIYGITGKGNPCTCVAGYRLDANNACQRVSESEMMSSRTGDYSKLDTQCQQSHGPGGIGNSIDYSVGSCACRDGYELTENRSYCTPQ